jgi:gamma-glutamyltranspeptidase/glutathione hydrolase
MGLFFLPRKPGEGALTLKHIDFAKWHRTPDCCSETGREVAISSGGPQTSAAGLQMVRQGGNVIDAAVAAAFCMAVERPQSMGIGGGGFLLVHWVTPEPKDYLLDFRETAPHRATRDMYLDAMGNVIPKQSAIGPLSVATPGLVAGLYEAHRKWGKLPWKTVLAPSIRLAREGFAVYPGLAEHIARHAAVFRSDPYLKSLFLRKDGSPLRTGDTLVQSDLAESLAQIAEGGAAPFYTGTIAHQIASFLREKGGLVDETDLRDYAVEWREPLRGAFHQYTFVTAPPPAAGGTMLIEMLNVLAGYNLKALSAEPSRYTQLLGEVMKRAYSDRSYFIGDPEFVDEPYHRLLSPEYASSLRKKINLVQSTPSREIRPLTAFPEDHGTAQLSILDAEGNAVSGTLTIDASFGALLAVPGTGIVLNDQMDDFSAKPGRPNLYGMVGGEANAIAPGKRPCTSSTPTIVFQDGRPVLVIGGAGGSRITSSVTQVILNDLALYPGDLKRAVFAARAHQQWMPDQLELEDGFPEASRARLRAMGNQIGRWPNTAQVEAVGRAPSGGLTAVFDPRDQGGVAAD